MQKKGKPKARGNGEGTIFKNSSGGWTVQYMTESGRKSKNFTSNRAARVFLTAQRRDMDTGDYVDPSQMPLGVWWDKWVDVYKSRSVTAATLDSYKYSRARLPEDLLLMPLATVTKADIQRALNSIADAGLRRRSVELARTALHMCMGAAVTDRMIRHNPVIGTVLPSEDRKESEPLTAEEEDALVAELLKPVRLTAKGRPDKKDLARQTFRDALLLILRTGIRREECIRLEWSDWNGKVLHIRGTKNEGADRVVPVTDPAVIAMLDRRRFRSKKLIFTSRRGTPVNPANLYHFMKELTGHTVHELRHTFITNAARAGVNPKVLMTITGHVELETLLGVYTHVSDQDKVDAVTKISGYCSAIAVSTDQEVKSAK